MINPGGSPDSSHNNMSTILDVFDQDRSQTVCSVRLPDGETHVLCRSPERGVTTLVYIQPRDGYDTRQKVANAAGMVKTIQAIKASAAAAKSATEGTAGVVTEPKASEYYYMLTQPSATDTRNYTDQVLTVMIDEGRHNYHHSRCTHRECPGWEKAQEARVLEERLRDLPAWEEDEWACNPSAVQLNERSGYGAIDTANPFCTFFDRVQGEACSRGERWPPGRRDQWAAESDDKFMAKLKSLHKNKNKHKHNHNHKHRHKHKHSHTHESSISISHHSTLNPNDGFETRKEYPSKSSKLKPFRLEKVPSRWRQWQADTDLVADRRSAPRPLAGLPIVASDCADRWHHRFCNSVLCPGSATEEEAREWAVRPRTPPLGSGSGSRSRSQDRGGESDSELTVWGDESDNALESGSGSGPDNFNFPKKRRRRTAKTYAEEQPDLREKMMAADSRGWGTRCRPDLSFPWLRYDDSLDAVGTFRGLPSTVMDEALSQRPEPVAQGGEHPLRVMRYLGDDGYDPETLRLGMRRGHTEEEEGEDLAE